MKPLSGFNHTSRPRGVRTLCCSNSRVASSELPWVNRHEENNSLSPLLAAPKLGAKVGGTSGERARERGSYVRLPLTHSPTHPPSPSHFPLPIQPQNFSRVTLSKSRIFELITQFHL